MPPRPALHPSIKVAIRCRESPALLGAARYRADGSGGRADDRGGAGRAGRSRGPGRNAPERPPALPRFEDGITRAPQPGRNLRTTTHSQGTSLSGRGEKYPGRLAHDTWSPEDHGSIDPRASEHMGSRYSDSRGV